MYNRYQTISSTKVNSIGARYFLNNIYPDIPVTDNDNYIITTLGDRLDILAQNFYGDIDFWWILASANALSGDSLYPPVGIQLRVPTNIVGIVNSYNQVNSIR
jgi:hypothetical protein